MLATRPKATDESGPPDSPCSLVSLARRSLTFPFPRSFASPLPCSSSSPAPLLLPLDRCVIGVFSAENPDNATVDSANHDPIERSEEHTSELQSRGHLVYRLLLVKMKVTTAVYQSMISRLSLATN